MDFFDRQDRARQRTRILVLYFGAAILAITIAVYLLVLVIVMPPKEWSNLDWLLNLKLLGGVFVGVSAVVGAGCLTKMAELSSGGPAVAAMLGGRPISPNTTDLDERKLMNVVEEMAIASGTPVPQVYVLDEETAINAFAAGFTSEDAVIAVTRGGLKLLTRDELQGVVAHEFSHVLNGDMRLNLRLIGILFGILSLAVIGRVLINVLGRSSSSGSRRKGDKGAAGLLLLGVGLYVIGYVGVFFGRLIQSAVSREREYLADASAVQFTRNPTGIAGALKKIGGLSRGSRLRLPNSQEASHLFFANAMNNFWGGWMATHPPLSERIQAIEPSFDGKYPKVELPPELRPPIDYRQAQPILYALAAGKTVKTRPSGLSIAPAAITALVGQLTAEHLAYASELKASLPPGIQEAARESLGAVALVLGTLVAADEPLHSQQMALLEAKGARGVAEEVKRWSVVLQSLDRKVRLAVIDLALPALRQMGREQFAVFAQNLTELIESDREVSLFEYMLQKIVRRHLEPQFAPARRPVVQFYSVHGLRKECSVLISGLAHMGHDDAARVEAAAEAGRMQLGQDFSLTLLDFSQCQLADIDQALEKMSQASPQVKKIILRACAHTVAADGKVDAREAELLRAIGDVLECPLPPFLGAGPPVGTAALGRD